MIDALLERLYDLSSLRRRTVFAAAMGLIAACAIGLAFVRYDADIGLVLPKDETVSRSLRFFRESDLSGRVLIWLELTDPARGASDLAAASDAAADALDRTVFSGVLAGPGPAPFADARGMIASLPSLLGPEDLDSIAVRIEQPGVAQALGHSYRSLLKPEGMIGGAWVREDPLGLGLVVLKRLSDMSAALGFEADYIDGHFMSRSGRHALLIASSTVATTDSTGGAALLESLGRSFRILPPYVTPHVISGHAHTVSNENRIRRDILMMSAAAAVLFVLLFGAVIRDARALLILALPLAGTLVAIVVSYALMGTLALSVVGLGSVMVGITIDYGTHLYFAARRSEDPASSVKQVLRPVCFGALTTVAMFAAFFLAHTTGYRQLALISITGVLVTLLLALFVLPHALRPASQEAWFTGLGGPFDAALRFIRRPGKRTVILWAVLTLSAGVLAAGVRFDGSIRSMDGTDPAVLAEEEAFREVWGHRTLAMLVAEGGTREGALELNDALARGAAASGAIPRGEFASVSPLLPSEKTAALNSARWREFFAPGRIAALDSTLRSEGASLGFADDAFAPFIAALKESSRAAPPPRPSLPPGIEDRFIFRSGDAWRAVSFFPDRPEYVEAMGRVAKAHAGSYVVAGSLFERRVSEIVSADTRRMIVMAAALVLPLTYLCFMDLRETLVALAPVTTGVLWLLGAFALAGIPITMASAMALVMTIGLASDYGIFITHGCRRGLPRDVVLAVSLCAASTLIGAGVLLIASHPALFYVGAAMSVGVGAGFACSLLVVPRLRAMLVGGVG